MNTEVTGLLRTYSTSRRQFLRASAIAGGLTALGTMAPSTVAGMALGRAAAAEGGDLGVLNYALTLEHLEATLYDTLVGSGLLDGQALRYAKVYGAHEAAHVDLLTKAITAAGGDPVEAEEEYNFPKFSSEAEVLDALVTVEDLGASAYLGAAPLIESDEYLTVAVQIHTVEAYHATGFRFLAGQDPVPFDFAEPSTMAEVLKAVDPFFVSMPSTGGGGTATAGSGAGTAAGVAGLGVAAAAGYGLVRRLRTPVAAERVND
jgi:hypothetical protein